MILQTDSLDGFIDSVHEAAIRASVDRLTVEDGTLVAGAALAVADALDASDFPTDRAGAADLRTIAVGLARLNSRKAASAKAARSPRRKSPAEIEAERQESLRRFEGEQARQQGLPVPYTEAEQREHAQAEAAARIRERARQEEQARLIRGFNEELVQQMGWGSQSERAARNEDLARREALARGETLDERR